MLKNSSLWSMNSYVVATILTNSMLFCWMTNRNVANFKSRSKKCLYIEFFDFNQFANSSMTVIHKNRLLSLVSEYLYNNLYNSICIKISLT